MLEMPNRKACLGILDNIPRITMGRTMDSTRCLSSLSPEIDPLCYRTCVLRDSVQLAHLLLYPLSAPCCVRHSSRCLFKFQSLPIH